MQEVARGIGLDNRIGAQVPACRPGLSAARAFPRTRWRWSGPAQDYGAPLRIVETVVAVNDQRKRAMARKVVAALRRRSCAARPIAVLGLTFKPNTDDMREAPSIAADHGAAGHGREGAGLRSGGHGGRPELLPRRRLSRTTPTTAPRAPTRW